MLKSCHGAGTYQLYHGVVCRVPRKCVADATLHKTAPNCTTLQYTLQHLFVRMQTHKADATARSRCDWEVLQCFAVNGLRVRCSMLQRAAARCLVLRCFSVRCSFSLEGVLQCVAIMFIVLYPLSLEWLSEAFFCLSMCCNHEGVLLCVAVRCSQHP